ncbi:MAG: cytochrome c biogenesis protein CcdA [Bacteroidota bacterium]
MYKLLTVVLSFFSTFLFAQENPVKFSFNDSIDAAGNHQLVIKAVIPKGIKLLSTNSIEALPDVKTSIVFDSSSKLKLHGNLATATKSQTEKSPALGDIHIEYFIDSVTWMQPVKVAKGDSFRIKGELTTYILSGEDLLSFSEPLSKEFIYKEASNTFSSETKSVIGWLLAGVLAGLIGFLTPCVYSLVPVTVSLFLKKNSTPRQGKKSALFYCFSIIVIYAIVGILSVLFVPQATWNAISTSWQFNLFVFLIFVIFGISFLGAFEINLPSSWANHADKRAGFGTYSGIFFMALTLVVVSFSCTGNFVAGLLGIASKTNKIAAVSGLTGFGIGLALPFALFAFFPSWVKAISKPGAWQKRMKITLGILEIAFAMKFLSNVDVQLGTFWFTRNIYLIIWIGLFAFLVLYLLGVFNRKNGSIFPSKEALKKHVPIPRFIFALIFLAFTIYLIPGLWGHPLNSISGLLPPYGTQEYGLNKGASNNNFIIKPSKYYNELKKNESAAAKTAGLEAFFDYDEAMSAAKEQGKPLMIDFTGIVCPNCREFENRVWIQPEVMNRMKNNFVVVSLFEDFAQELPDAEKRFSPLLGSQINTVGDKFKELSMKLTGGISQPNYIFLNHDGTKIIEKSYGYDDVQKNGIQDFVKHLDLAVQNFRPSK